MISIVICRLQFPPSIIIGKYTVAMIKCVVTDVNKSVDDKDETKVETKLSPESPIADNELIETIRCSPSRKKCKD